MKKPEIFSLFSTRLDFSKSKLFERRETKTKVVQKCTLSKGNTPGSRTCVWNRENSPCAEKTQNFKNAKVSKNDSKQGQNHATSGCKVSQLAGTDTVQGPELTNRVWEKYFLKIFKTPKFSKPTFKKPGPKLRNQRLQSLGVDRSRGCVRTRVKPLSLRKKFFEKKGKTVFSLFWKKHSFSGKRTVLLHLKTPHPQETR